jgi:hypothetical protein
MEAALIVNQQPTQATDLLPKMMSRTATPVVAKSSSVVLALKQITKS